MRDDARRFVERFWDGDALEFLYDFIRIPNVSPHFDPEWERNGHMAKAVATARLWGEQRGLTGFEVEVHHSGGLPALLMSIDGGGAGNVLLYGHLDKQPALDGWEPDLGPWTPVRRGDRLFGRGSVDDGYSVCVALGAIEALQRAGRSFPKCSVLLECGEESGSERLPDYLEHFADRISTPDMVIALDSEAGDYERLWVTTSLRGWIGARLQVAILEQAVHAGLAGGVVPSTFRVIRHLLDRLEDPKTGELLPAECRVPVPIHRAREANDTAAILGEVVVDKFPWRQGVRPVSDDPATLLVNNAWRGCLTVTGAGGIPSIADASSTHLPDSSLVLSVRLPPTADAYCASEAIRRLLENDPPYGAHVKLEIDGTSSGWNAPAMPEWLAAAVNEASNEYFGNDAAFIGTGGTIPFVRMLADRFPDSVFLVTGASGPDAGEHGPNESLHLPTARRLTGCLASILESFARHG